MAIRVTNPTIRYLNGSDRVEFSGSVQRGNGRHAVEMLLDPATIVSLARYLAPVLDDEDSGARGHALWHWERPSQPYPCSQCRHRVEKP